MKIVIDIPNDYAEQFYKNKCKDKFDSLATNEFGYVLRKAFEDAKPLPEHHGDLIDVNVLKNNIHYVPTTPIFQDDYVTYRNVIFADILDMLPTIIEGSDTE